MHGFQYFHKETTKVNFITQSIKLSLGQELVLTLSWGTLSLLYWCAPAFCVFSFVVWLLSLVYFCWQIWCSYRTYDHHGPGTRARLLHWSFPFCNFCVVLLIVRFLSSHWSSLPDAGTSGATTTKCICTRTVGGGDRMTRNSSSNIMTAAGDSKKPRTYIMLVDPNKNNIVWFDIIIDCIAHTILASFWERG